MPRIYVDLTCMRQIGNDCKNVANNVDNVHDKLLRTVRQLDWDVRGQENINATANKIGLVLGSYANALKSYKTFIDETYKQYSALDNASSIDEPFLVKSDWFGYEFDKNHPGVTAWIGKASCEEQGEWGYANVNAYVGKIDAEAKASFDLMEYKTKTEYKDGEWTSKEVLSFFNAEAGIAAGVSIFALDGKVKVGNDMLGANVAVEGKVFDARVGIKGKTSIGKDGANAYVKGEAMVAAVEGKAKGTLNIGGIEIKGEISGYAGAAGVEGEIGIKDNNLIIKGGAAAVLGFSGGIEIGFNETGWDNFIMFLDYLTFWD